MDNNKAFHVVDVFGLFEDLYSKGSTRLSDHFLDDPEEKENSNNNK